MRVFASVTASRLTMILLSTLLLAACSGDDGASATDPTGGTATSPDELSDDELFAEPEVGTEAPQIDSPVTERSRAAGADGYVEMDWGELVPSDFSLAPQVQELDLQNYNIAELDDNDPEAQRLYAELKAILADVPSSQELQGVKARLPGFAVPIEFDGNRVYSFLLVPYFGACIHTPPPPANQMVYVEYETGFELPSLYEPVIIEGAFEVATHVEDGLGTAGYSMRADRVTLY
ncbi:DUF3299 domain-containing protein [Natronospirillum operosum]|uniref:DUF3299 domain-containing protein n=1 Tax=Natronospirillum operosum TaxID=2759953 RepID=A0A4Z0W1Z3_9GAMM|nr:DUF3299 domain-containing protein [Natronospirillum operosum]TGG90653.1 DUF3299 domain-containing protein [Natronospirillum operosum]